MIDDGLFLGLISLLWDRVLPTLSSMMLKWISLFLLASSSTAFVGPQHQQISSTALHVSTSPQDFQRKNDWEDRGRYEPKSTPSVPVKKVSGMQRALMEDVIIEQDFFLAWAVALLGPLIMWYHPSYAVDGTPSLIGIFGGGFHILFAALLWVQTARVRCVFEKDAFEFYNVVGKGLDLSKGAKLKRKPDNYVAGTRNRWSYDSITNYGFFPSREFPVICYFKETETPEWKWNRWFAAFDSYGRGQPHFFPGICNVHQFEAEMERRGVAKKRIPTLKHPNTED